MGYSPPRAARFLEIPILNIVYLLRHGKMKGGVLIISAKIYSFDNSKFSEIMAKPKSEKRQTKKKKRRYPQSGKSVFLIQKLRRIKAKPFSVKVSP